MLNEESKERLIKAIFTLKKENEEISDEDLAIAQDLIETHPDLTDLDRKIVKLRIYRGMMYREITDLLELEKSHTAQNRFHASTGKITKLMYTTKRLNGDKSEKLSKLMKTRNSLLALRRAGIETIGKLTECLKNQGDLREVKLDASRIASVIYYLDRDGYDLRKFVTDHRLLEEFEELDRRNYVHVDHLEVMLKNCSRVKSVKRVTNSYTVSSKTEFGSFDVELNDSQILRLKISIKSTEDQYTLNAEIEETESFEEFEYQKTVSREVSTDSENLESALNFLLFVSRKSVNQKGTTHVRSCT